MARANGEGNIRKRSDGRWEARYSINNGPDGKTVRRSIYGNTQKEVSEKLTNTLNKINKGDYIDPSSSTVEQWLEMWFETYKKPSVSPVTYESYVWQMQRYIVPHIGHIPLKDLTSIQVQATLNKLTGLSQRTIKYTYTVFNQAMKRAVRDRLIEGNPCEYIDLPKGTKPKKIEVLSFEEQIIFLEAIKDHQYEMAFLLLISSGLRIGELLGLSWTEVNFEKETVSIVKGLSRSKQVMFTELKTDDSDRIVPLLTSVVKRLKKHKTEQNKIKLQVGQEYNPYNLVITNQYGYPVNFDTFNRSLKLLLKNNGLTVLSAHKLRHTFATRGLELGVEMKEIQELLGHSTMELTSDLYTHVLIDQKKKAINKTSYLFDKSNK